MIEDEIDDFLKNEELKKTNIFESWKYEIFYMKKKGAKLESILKYLFTKDLEIKERYTKKGSRILTGTSLLSRFIKKNEGYKFKDSTVKVDIDEQENIETKTVGKLEEKKEPINKSALLSKAKDSKKMYSMEYKNGTIDQVTDNYLESLYHHTLDERNYTIVGNNYKKKKYIFEEVSKIAIKEKILKENSLFIHYTNGQSNMKLHIYRYKNNRLIFLGEKDCVGKLEYIEEGQKMFFELFKRFL